ncbi:MAG: periplasmic heavy metal sensor [Myxococcales bacterium]|nr:periplasmic heavy metal sensor [Myxococcales bacterium]
MVCSISMVLGVLGALAVAKMIARRRFGRCGGRGRGWGHGRFGRFGAGLSWLLRRLEATPAQEKEVRSALNDVRGEMYEARAYAAEARADLAAAVSGEVFDEEAYERAAARLADAAERVRLVLRKGLERVHATLDPEQRRRLVEMFERKTARRTFDPYRGWGF